MDIDRILQSIVAVRSHVPDDAFTASGLGTLREGSGVVIGEHGLVLTIGYLITEAEEVWLTTQEGRVVAAHALAYDQETGFGLVQALGDFDLPTLEFGSSAEARLGDPVVLADGVGRFVDGNAIAARGELVRRGQSGDAGSEDGNGGAHRNFGGVFKSARTSETRSSGRRRDSDTPCRACFRRRREPC